VADFDPDWPEGYGKDPASPPAPPDKKRGSDFADLAIDCGDDAVRDALNAARWPGPEEPPPHLDDPFAGGFTVAAGASSADPLPIEWGEEIEPRLSALWLIKRTLPQQGLALIFGHPGSGKTFLALDMALHIALGWDWHGLRVRKGLVVYVCAEGQNGARNRVAAFRRHHGLTGQLPFAMLPCAVDLFDPAADRGRVAAAVRRAAERYAEAPALIMIDTISKTMGAGKENTDDLATYVANCGWLASEFGCCVMPVHHRPKDQESADPRGHGSLKGGIDTMILVEAGKPKRARITKQRDDEERDLIMFNLRVHELGIDEDGDPVTSCTLEPTLVDLNPKADPFTLAVGRLSANNRLIFDQLGSVIEAEGIEPVPAAIPDSEIDRLRVGKVALLEAWRDKSISAAGTQAGHSRDTGKKTFNRALTSLRRKGVVRVWNEWAWITYAMPQDTGTSAGQ